MKIQYALIPLCFGVFFAPKLIPRIPTRTHVTAPSTNFNWNPVIFQSNGTNYMFYYRADSNGVPKINLAWSTNLVSWNKIEVGLTNAVKEKGQSE